MQFFGAVDVEADPLYLRSVPRDFSYQDSVAYKPLLTVSSFNTVMYNDRVFFAVVADGFLSSLKTVKSPLL